MGSCKGVMEGFFSLRWLELSGCCFFLAVLDLKGSNETAEHLKCQGTGGQELNYQEVYSPCGECPVGMVPRYMIRYLRKYVCKVSHSRGQTILQDEIASPSRE